ncbi:class I SAM-dependent methyltransferase [Nocardia sp. NPDC060259]|uniref:class I SAM-dependent methyltransferase n=1 Tax=Nocardia sp. NPDC060259 TaxID=3347088 RepID=UPI003657F776
MSTTSVIYRHTSLYNLLMRGLYGRHYGARFEAIAALIPAGAEVLDLCCGPATLYTRYLRGKSVRYTGFDINERFISRLVSAGGNGLVWNLREDTALPRADYVVMQASLYHFLPEPEPIVRRMLEAARKQVIIAEPIRNLTTSSNRTLARLSGRFTDAGEGAQAHRFTRETLDRTLTHYATHVASTSLIAGGREQLCVLTPHPQAHVTSAF